MATTELSRSRRRFSASRGFPLAVALVYLAAGAAWLWFAPAWDGGDIRAVLPWHHWAFLVVTAASVFAALSVGRARSARAIARFAESEERYRQLVESSGDAIFMFTDDRVAYANRAGLALLGAQAAEEVVGRSRFDFLHPGDREESRARVEAMTHGKRLARVVHRIVRVDGAVVLGEIASAPTRYRGRPAVMAVVRDVTERQRQMEALERARVAMDSAPEAIFLVDRQTLRYVDVNDEACRMLGYAREELLGMGPAEVTVGYDEAQFRTLFAGVADAGQRGPRDDPIRRRLRTKTGAQVPVEVRRTLLRSGGREIVVALARDVSDRLRSEFEAERFRAALDVAADGIYLVDRATLRFLDANQTACRLLGYSRELLLSMGPLDVFVGLSRVELEILLDEAIASAPEALRADTTRYVRRRDGTVVPVEIIRSARQIEDRFVIVSVLRDMTERRRAEEALRLKTRAVEASENAIMLVDFRRPDQPIEYVNPAFERMTGYAAHEVLGRNCRFLHRDDRDQPDLERIRVALRDGIDAQALLRNYRKDGRLFWNQLVISPIRDDDRVITHFVGVATDVTELNAYRRELEHRATHDALTGLANRSLLEDRLAMSVAQSHRHQRLVAVAFVDLDHFKAVNDTLGHATGDALLIAVSERLKGCIREGDTLARQGGDEFILVLNDTSEAALAQVLERVCDVIAEPFLIAGHELRIGCSIGVSLAPRDGRDPTELIRRADEAMYDAKAAGRGAWRFAQ